MVTAVAEANAEAAVPWEISPNSDTSTTHELERQLASASRAVDRARRNNLYRGSLFSHGSTLMAPPSSAVLAPQQLLPPSLHEFRVLAGAKCDPRGRCNFCGVSAAVPGPGSRPVGTRDAKQGVMCGRPDACADSPLVSSRIAPRGSGTNGAMFSCIC